MLTHGIPLAFRSGAHVFIPPFAIESAPRLSGHASNCAPMVFTAESPPKFPVVLKVVPVTGGAAFSGFTTDQFLCASLFPRPLFVCIRYIYICCVIKKVSETFYASTGCDWQSCSWSADQGFFFPFPFMPSNLVSRYRFGRPVPRQPAHSPYPG